MGTWEDIILFTFFNLIQISIISFFFSLDIFILEKYRVQE